MASNKTIDFGPVALTNAVANLINPPTLTGGTGLSGTNTNTYVIIRFISIVNKTAGAVTATFYLGATGGSAAGTEVLGNGLIIPANSSLSLPVLIRLDPSQYLTGLASANTSLTFFASGEIGVV